MFDLKLTVCECCATAIAGGECGCPEHPESTANGTEVLVSFDADERHDRCDLCAAEGYLRFYEAEGRSLCEHGMNPANCSGPDHFMTADQERAMWPWL